MMFLTLNSVKASMVFAPFFFGEGMISCKLNNPSSSILTDVLDECGKARVTRRICEVRYLYGESDKVRQRSHRHYLRLSEKGRNEWGCVSDMVLSTSCKARSVRSISWDKNSDSFDKSERYVRERYMRIAFT